MNDDCLSDEEVQAALEQRAPAEALARLHRHIDVCDACCALVGDATRAVSDTPSPAIASTIESTATSGAPAVLPGLARGTAVGRYLILERIGEGGMGVVYAAYDPELDRRIALKLIRTDIKSEAQARALRNRLQREAQAMARLAHPNVVRIYDVGLSGDQIFIVMEMITGRTLRSWLAEEAPPWRTILSAYRQAGQALAAAHRVDIVHRDFKPDNALIDAAGHVRVLDFGLARPGSESEERPAPDVVAAANAEPVDKLTRTGALIGTPAYMAPEQLTGKPAGAAADQFSCCVALYEALWQQRPFAGNTVAELTRSVVAGELLEPPRNARAPMWIFRILARGLRPNPDERHPSMDVLLTELLRDPARVRRKWLGSVALIALAAAAVAGVLRAPRAAPCSGDAPKVAATWNADRRRIMHDAFTATHKSFAEASFVETARTLDGYLAAWRNMHSETCTATRVRGEQSEEVMELRMECLEQRRQEVGALVDLFTQADGQVVQRAVQATQGLASLEECRSADALRQVVRPPAGATARASVAALRARMAGVDARIKTGKFKEARSAAEAAVASARELDYAPALAEALYWRGFLEDLSGDSKTAVDSLQASVAAAEAGRFDWQRARSLCYLVWVFGQRLARYPEAHWSYALGRAALARAGGDPLLEANLDDYDAVVLRTQARYDEALTLQKRVVARMEQLVDPNDSRLAAVHLNMGLLYVELGDFDHAVASDQHALAIYLKTYGPDHPFTGSMWSNLGTALSGRGDSRGAVEANEKALAIYQAELGPDHPVLGSILQNLGTELISSDRERARAMLERALAIKLKAYGPNHPLVSYTEGALATVFEHLGQLDVALAHAERALAISELALGAEHPKVAQALTRVGHLRIARHQPGEAIALLERSAAILERHPADPQLLAGTRFELARALWDSGRDRARARTLALTAHAQLAAGSRADVDAWLAKHR